MKKSGNFYIEEAESDFKKVHKSIIQDKDIDCLTLGIYVKILVLGKTWQLNIKGLSSYFGISDMKIRRSISLLEKKGYIARKPIQDETTGKLAGWDYIVYAKPINQEKRTNAGVKTVYPENRQHGYPTTRLSDNTETGEDNNNKLKEDIDLKEIDKPNQYKEEKDKSFSKKDDFSSLAAESQAEYDKPKKKRKVTPKDDALFEECWKEYRRKGNKALAKPIWDKIPQDVRECIMPHIKAYVSVRERSYQEDFQRYLKNKTYDTVVFDRNTLIYDPERTTNKDEYRPVESLYLSWDERFQCYVTCSNIEMLCDGYTDENRPNGAKVMRNGYIFVWNSEQKKWVNKQ